MKNLIVITLSSMALATVAGPIVESNPALPTITAAQQTTIAIKNLPDWASLTNDRASYVIDKQDYTGKVAQVSDAPTKQAIKAAMACTQDLQAQINDLKRIILAVANNTTNSAIISQ